MRTALLILLGATFTVSPLWAQLGKTKSTSAVQSVVRKPQTTTPLTYTGGQLMVGGGGGVTGYTATYYLLDDGRLYGRHTRDKDYRLISTQKPAITKQMFSTVEKQCKIKTTKFDEPGNMSRFIAWRKGRQYYKVTWGAGNSTVPTEYPKFYNTFMAMIPASARLK